MTCTEMAEGKTGDDRKEGQAARMHGIKDRKQVRNIDKGRMDEGLGSKHKLTGNEQPRYHQKEIELSEI